MFPRNPDRSDGATTPWHRVRDNLNIRMYPRGGSSGCSAKRIEDDLGEKGKIRILESMVTREAFLRMKTHRIHFSSTPTHASWLNQIEIWFSILARKRLRRNFALATGHQGADR